MKELVSESPSTPMLFPFSPAEYWQQIRQIIREEVGRMETRPTSPAFETPGMTYKPLYKIAEVCALLHITKPTIYDWVKHGKLKPYKIRSRVYFLWQDIQQLLRPNETIQYP
ncbi:MAG: helix-turn-helix domain-containing protein [Sphingobacteriales bacterium]|nr:helix-turn-helix domain-containing protein [Sphingobacteriales bacterium]OJV98519.1 MAG: DNA-binding protein [Sphingobacteriales bacterium 44-61]